MRLTKTFLLSGRDKKDLDKGDILAINRDMENIFTALQTFELRPREVSSDPQDATPGDRPKANRVSELVYYSGDLYFCTDTSTPTWKKITAT